MSKDKHKKRDRAYTFLRGLHWGAFHERSGERVFSGPMTPVTRYCVERGMAVLRRVRKDCNTNRRNTISAWTEPH